MCESIKQNSAETIKYAVYSVVRTINSKHPWKDLDSSDDLLAALGKAFYLNIRMRNNGKLLQGIRYKAEVGLEKPQRDFVVELKDKTAIERCYLGRSLLLPLASDKFSAVKEEPVDELQASPFPIVR